MRQNIAAGTGRADFLSPFQSRSCPGPAMQWHTPLCHSAIPDRRTFKASAVRLRSPSWFLSKEIHGKVVSCGEKNHKAASAPGSRLPGPMPGRPPPPAPMRRPRGSSVTPRWGPQGGGEAGRPALARSEASSSPRRTSLSS